MPKPKSPPLATPAPTLSSLKPRHLSQLSALFSLPSTTTSPTDATWVSDQKQQITRLSATLLRPSALLLRFAMHLPCSLTQAVLCRAHKPLNPFLIHNAFLAVVAETSVNLKHLTAEHGSGGGIEIPDRIQVFVRRLQALNSLWMDPNLYRVAFSIQPHEPRFPRIGSDCEACILSFIGGNAQTISDLRAALLSQRRKENHTNGVKKQKGGERKETGLLRLVEAWMDNFDEATREKIGGTSERLGRDVRRLRKEMQGVRREKKRRERYGGISDPHSHAQGGDGAVVVKTSESRWDSSDSTLYPTTPARRIPTSYPVDDGDEDGTIRISYDDRRSFSSHTNSNSNPNSNPNSNTDTSSLLPHHHHHPSPPFDVQDPEDQDEDTYTRDSLISYYASLTTTASPSTKNRNSIHPSFLPTPTSTSSHARKDSATYSPSPITSPTTPLYPPSIIYNHGPSTGTFTQRARHRSDLHNLNPFKDHDQEDEKMIPAPLAPHRPAQTTYSASLYSRNESEYVRPERPHMPFGEGLRRNAEEQARRYRELVGLEVEIEVEEEFIPVAPAPVRYEDGDLNRASRTTRWTDYY